MKIDVYAHILPPKYKKTLDKEAASSPAAFYTTQRVLPTLFDLDLRFRIMDKFEDLMNISDAEKKMIFEDNARSLLRLPV